VRAHIERRGDIGWLGVIVVVGAIIRFATLGVQSTWTDEVATASYLHGSLKQTLLVLPVDTNPPLFYVLEWIFVRVFGQGDVGLRVLSAVAGTLTIPVLYAIGRVVASSRAGLVAAVLGAVQPMLWWYSQEARPYALFTLLGALALLGFVIALRDRSVWGLALWAVCGGLMLTTHYFSVVALAPQAGWLLVSLRGRRRETLIAFAGLAVVLIALSMTAALQSEAPEGISHLPFAPRARVLLPQLMASPSPPATAIWVGAVALALAGAGLALTTTQTPQLRFARVLGVLTVWDLVFPIVLAKAGADFVDTRNLIGALIPLLPLAAIGFASPSALRAGPALAAVTAALWLSAVLAIVGDRGLQRIDVKGAVASLGRPAVDRVILAPGSYLFTLVLPRYATGASLFGDGRVPVQEIDVLVPHPGPGTPPCLAGQTCELFETQQAAGPPAPAFALVSRADVTPFTIWRWRAPQPELLKVGDVVNSAPRSPQWVPLALYQQRVP
jgi:4-amino-4-deoxy-L-arabinose transferase-like glycosyltransferase